MSKVLLVNGSPRKKGCTYTALSEVAHTLEELGVEAEIIHAGVTVAGCKSCGRCTQTGLCVQDDVVNDVIRRIDTFDGLVVGSPVYYSGASGQICSFMDRLFYAASSQMAGKLGAAVTSCRRGGATAAFERLNQYFLISNMMVVGSQYWNQVHGSTPEQVLEDVEGMQTMRTLARNMAWMLKCIEAGRNADVQFPEREPAVFTNFIR